MDVENIPVNDLICASSVDILRAEQIRHWAVDRALSTGICMRDENYAYTSEIVHFAPFSLFPSPIPRACFEQAMLVQQDFNLLYHYVSNDYGFIKESLASVISTDQFTSRLLDIYTQIHSEGMAQPLVLSIQRADYMFHVSLATATSNMKSQLKQVEVNNISASFAGLNTRVNALHAYIYDELGYARSAIDVRLPKNTAATTLAEGLLQAWKAYGNSKAVVLFVVEPRCRNIFDQRIIEYTLRDLSGNQVPVKRLTFLEAHVDLQLDEISKVLRHSRENYEVAVIYYRTGYVPNDYTSEGEWSARLKLERSKAIKCPWIGFHLSGTKKVQQVLTQPGAVERFIKDPAAVQRITDTFMAMYGFDADKVEADEAYRLALQNPDAFVLKPQLEGGGHNFYGADVAAKLKSLSEAERGAYILMERIYPLRQSAYLVRPVTGLKLADTVSELGIFGFLVGSKDMVIANTSGGFLLRTKDVGTNEGGVMAGASVLDSPLLVD